MEGYVERLVGALRRWRRFVTHDVWRIGRPGEPPPHGFIAKQIRVFVLLVQGLIKDALLLRAAALTFATMLAIVPLLAILLFVIQTFELEENIIREFVRLATAQEQYQEDPGDPPDKTQGTSGRTSGLPPETGGESEEDPPDAVTLQEDVPAADDNQEDEDKEDGDKRKDEEAPYEDIIQFLTDAAKRGTSPSTLGIWGAFFITWTVFGLIQNIESSFNQIWGLKRTRSYYRMFTNYVLVILILPFVAAGLVSKAVEDLGWAVSILRLAVAWAAFTSVYFFVPNTRVKVRYAVLGGVVAGTLWTLVTWAYVNQQFGRDQYTLFYSTFAQFPILLMWIYVSWIILLFGAELVFAYQNEKTFAMERLSAGASHAYREAVGLRAMMELARRFDAGLPGLEAAAAAEAWNVPTRVVNETLRQLAESGLARECATEPVTYQPGRSPDKITVHDVVNALREAGRDPSELREDEAFQPLLTKIGGVREGILGQTMLELMKDRRFRQVFDESDDPPGSDAPRHRDEQGSPAPDAEP